MTAYYSEPYDISHPPAKSLTSSDFFPTINLKYCSPLQTYENHLEPNPLQYLNETPKKSLDETFQPKPILKNSSYHYESPKKIKNLMDFSINDRPFQGLQSELIEQ